MKLLLIGATGSPYFEHCKQEMLDFLGSSKTAGLISAANVFDEKSYYQKMQEALVQSGRSISQELVHIRWDSGWRDALKSIDALIIPGGNTYVLLKRLRESGLLDALRERIRKGLPYIGSSAGANVAGPNILTTNDWNVVGLRRFDSLGVVPFNINPHYVERAASDAPHAETRDLRIREYHQVWSNPVVGIEETALVRILDDKISIVGKGRVKVFARGDRKRWFEVGEELVCEGWTSLSEDQTQDEQGYAPAVAIFSTNEP